MKVTVLKVFLSHNIKLFIPKLIIFYIKRTAFQTEMFVTSFNRIVTCCLETNLRKIRPCRKRWSNRASKRWPSEDQDNEISTAWLDRFSHKNTGTNVIELKRKTVTQLLRKTKENVGLYDIVFSIRGSSL